MFSEGFPAIPFLFFLFYFAFCPFFLYFTIKSLRFHPTDGRQPFLPCSKEEIPATELSTIPGRSHRIPGLVFKVLVSCSVFCPRLIFMLNVAQIAFYLHFQLLLSLLKANPSPFGHSTSYCWPFYDLQITQMHKNDRTEFLKIHLCSGSFSTQIVEPFMNLPMVEGKRARFQSGFSTV